jgi:hypothetical protein
MKIQLTDDSIGKRFLTREGEEVVCTEKDSNSSNFPYCFSDGKWRTIDGDFNIIGDHQYDIISEIKQENNMEEIIENILHRLGKYTNTTRQEINDRRTILTEELSKLNPYKIDEERMKPIYERYFDSVGYSDSQFKRVMQQYNSTAQEPPQQLKPLPQEMPEWFANMFNWSSPKDMAKIWKELINHFGTPQKAELPSVEELERDLMLLKDHTIINVAQHIVDKYALHTPEKKWWMDLKKGDKFVCDNKIIVSDGNIYLFGIGEGISDVNNCTPYIESEFQREYKKWWTEDGDVKKLIKLACEEAIKTGNVPEL